MELPHESALRWLVGEYAGLCARHGEAVGRPELVEPTSDFFPDSFALDGPSVAQLMKRLLSYAPVSAELGIALRFVEANEEAASCGTGACCSPGPAAGKGPLDRVVEVDDGYIVDLPVAYASHPTLLTTSLARSAGAIILSEADEEVDPEHLPAMSELAASFCGFGVLLINGAHLYGKSCGGVRIATHTHLSVEEHALLLALFCERNGVKPGVVKAHLQPTQKEAFAAATSWLGSHPRLAADLRERPETLTDGLIPEEPSRGWLGRLFGGTPKPEDEAPVVSKRPARTEEEERRWAEAKALVEEAFQTDK